MEPEELRRLLKKGAIVGSFFAVALLFYALNLRFMLIVYVALVGVLAVLAILLQAGRGGGLAASLGGLGADSLLGTHSATPIAKATYVMLALFIFISILTARMGASEVKREGLLPAPAPAQRLIPPAEERLGTGLPIEAQGTEAGDTGDAPAQPVPGKEQP